MVEHLPSKHKALSSNPHPKKKPNKNNMVLNFSKCLKILFDTGSPYTAQAGLKLETLLPQASQGWDYRRAPPHLA
jgi:hypothetical protein